MIKKLKAEISSLTNFEKAELTLRFFKTAKGEYGEGDKFLGITVPKLRALSKKYNQIKLEEAANLLRSEWHEERLLALFILILQYNRSNQEIKNEIFQLYIDHYAYINNWDLVDSSAAHIVGAHICNQDKSLIYQWAQSNHLWKRRIAIVSTHHFIKKDHFTDTLKISESLLQDNDDLIHKAVGWMLREVGKRNRSVLQSFLKKHYKNMPRVMLRYAIEKFDNNERTSYLLGLI